MGPDFMEHLDFIVIEVRRRGYENNNHTLAWNLPLFIKNRIIR